MAGAEVWSLGIPRGLGIVWGEDQPFMLAGKPGIMDGVVGIKRRDAGIWSTPLPQTLTLSDCAGRAGFTSVKLGTLPALILGHKGLK